MAEGTGKYPHHEIEQKWQAAWRDSDIYKAQENSSKPKTYVLDMFPYPSGEGLHVGHPKGYIATDIYSRHMRMKGREVLHPMGWDAFGLPAENFAIKNKVHPRVAVEKNIANFKAQLAHIGFDYDWSREINTTDPAYYKWTQWIFLKLLEKGLAYQSDEPINWCPSCMTGLANEDLDGNVCERCGIPVEKKRLPQWVLKITAYADRMLADLDALDWPEHIKEAQRNWIGRSEGAQIDFTIRFEVDPDKNNAWRDEQGKPAHVTVFTTRPDTLFGATYLVLAPEHPWLAGALRYNRGVLHNADDVATYIAAAAAKSDIERSAEGKEKTGVELKGVKAINPATKEEIPVFVADYVLGGYGTGAIMAVPAHDERDHEFAVKFSLPIKQVILPDVIGAEKERGKEVAILRAKKEANLIPLPYVGNGKLINSDQFDGMNSEEAKKAIVEFVGGKLTTNYKIRDWVFSRQRYWGEPIPVVHCAKDGVVPVPEDQLPVVLPEVESYEPSGTGESPLANIDSWVNTTCPKCGGPAKRETNTMPQWAGSSWYYLRFMDPHNDQALVGKDKEKYWAPVDVYVGGDHAVRHLIYARFWHKFLYDIGAVSTTEPFARLEFLGFILAEDGRKMSKRYGNVINPDDVVREHGADAFRVYEMFMGPFENTVAWSTKSLVGAERFIDRVWRLAQRVGEGALDETVLHQTIKKVSEDIEAFKFNTAVSQMMICLNAAEEQGIAKEQWLAFLRLLAPFAPHITEELWQRARQKGSVHTALWPEFDPAKIVAATVRMGVQVDGKLRATIDLSPSASQDEATSLAKADPMVAKWLGAGEARVVYVPGKILSFSTKGSSPDAKSGQVDH